jgi:hypothetical protein
MRLCECGCGAPTRLMPYNDASRGWVKGQPFRFIRGHQGRNASAKSHHELYWVWKSMIGRCENPRDVNYFRYGARGIFVCEAWHSFDQFLSDMGPRPRRHSVDRIDNDGPYAPWNCRWATSEQQMANTRLPISRFDLNGEPISLNGMARRLAMRSQVLAARLRGKAFGLPNAARTHCPAGHEYTPANTHITKKLGRLCRACGRERQRVNRERAAAAKGAAA